MAGTVVASTINNDTGLFSTNNAYLGIAKAWVNYNLSTQTIRASFNVSSITYVSTGLFNINFTTAMPDANYSVTATGADGSAGTIIFIDDGRAAPTTTTVYMRCVGNSSTANINTAYTNVQIIGN